LQLHPDKNKGNDTSEQFLEVAKAVEVLGDNVSKELFDYYLDHPTVRPELIMLIIGSICAM
jgi:DnaJ-class molecular chaperone